MSKFVFTIRVKLLFAFGIGVTIIFMAGLVGALQLCHGNAEGPLLFTEDFKLVVASTDKIYAAFFSW